MQLKEGCPLKWTSDLNDIRIYIKAISGVSTKVDKLKKCAQINIEDSKVASTKVDKY